MSRIVYLFESKGSAEVPVPWDPKKPAVKGGVETEGFWYLWKELLDRSIVDEILFVIESARGSGSKRWTDKFNMLVVPHIDQLEEYLRKDDILFVRCGFRPWFQFLERLAPEKRWVLFYRAASNRGKWHFWDIVFEDVTDKSFAANDRLYYKFNKPIHPKVFCFRDRQLRDIDVMFHASHIHDRKGQWRCVDAAIAYRNKYGKNFIGVMPGGDYGGEKTQGAYRKIEKYNLPIWVPGMVPREDLNRWMNRSKLYLHLGGAGQNDRGNLEAMICGCQQMIGMPKYHPPFVYENPEISTVIQDINNPDMVAEQIHSMLSCWKPNIPAKVTEYYQKNNGVDVAVEQMRVVIDFIKKHKVPDRALAIKELM